MKKLAVYIEEVLKEAFKACEYDENFAKVTVSNRPDLCEYQCNGAMAAAKTYRKAPIMIAGNVVEKLQENPVFESVEAVNPGFINLKVNKTFLADYLNRMLADSRLSVEEAKNPKTIVIDYGGPNVAKPLHVGHLRSAIIGESIKRMGRFLGHKVIGDVHLGDWGLQMGLIITELSKRKPELVYFDESYEGEYPKERLSQSVNWKKFILQPAANPKQMRRTKTKRWKQPYSCSRAEEVIGLCGNTLWKFLSMT